MSNRKFLVPVGVAVAVLISSASHADQTQAKTNKIPLGLAGTTVVGKEPSDPVLQRLLDQINAEQDSLLLRKPASGIIYAQHRSHESHESHASHQSHRSRF